MDINNSHVLQLLPQSVRGSHKAPTAMKQAAPWYMVKGKPETTCQFKTCEKLSMKTRPLLIACRHLQEIYNRTGSSNETGQILEVKANLQKTMQILGAESKYHIAQISLQPCLCDKHLADADMACVN